MLSIASPSTALERDDLVQRTERLQRAAAFYRDSCAACHGETGNGNAAARPPVPDFAAPSAVASLSAERMVAALRRGHDDATRARWSGRDDADIAAVVGYIREIFTLPAAVADASVGRRIYARTCSVCHGDRGDGASWARNGLNPPPLDFTAPRARALTRLQMLNAVTFGKPGTAMVGFSIQLTAQEIAAAVDYIRAAFVDSRLETMLSQPLRPVGGAQPAAPARALAPAAAVARDRHGHDRHGHDHKAGPADMAALFADGLMGDSARGQHLYAQNCVACHGTKGDGQGPRAYFMTRKPQDFTSATARQELNRPHLFAGISAGVFGAEMPAWSTVLDAQQIADVAEYVFASFILSGPAPASAPASHDHGQAHHHDHDAGKKN